MPESDVIPYGWHLKSTNVEIRCYCYFRSKIITTKNRSNIIISRGISHNLLSKDGYFIFSQEHPIGTGTILNAKFRGKDNIDLGDKNYYLVSDYNLNGKRIVNWNNCDVIKFHRNFSYIINTIIKCNFKIEEILEPIPDEEILNIKPKYKNQFDKPYFLFVKVSKER